MRRRLFLASSLAAVGLAGCANVKAALTGGTFDGVLDTAQALDERVIGTRGAARLYTPADVERTFRVNGLDTPSDATYDALVADDFHRYTLAVSGAVERPDRFTLAALRALPQRAQITRFDCVEGWSAIGRWSGVPLGTLLALVRPKPEARYVVFRCFDRDPQGTPFYGSLDLQQAAHPQTLLALDLNDRPIDADHGGPVRVRIPTQLGYKNTKWVQRIEVVASFAQIGGGHGGYWEDQGYAWYAGI
ncbi:MAG TPA: molybdopterin-dependent oxidoreductase [Candidatus Limnocylindria bacterium]|jgi:DMSO/TMAO reductase YedYZ molybdopterin-dependent catalytic subunit|nr:molybdopterin-dependent oxidoreductase [Candidatus Limnocylindria bacterium]